MRRTRSPTLLWSPHSSTGGGIQLLMWDYWGGQHFLGGGQHFLGGCQNYPWDGQDYPWYGQGYPRDARISLTTLKVARTAPAMATIRPPTNSMQEEFM